MMSAAGRRLPQKVLVFLLVAGGLLLFLSVAVDGYRTLRAVQQETGLRAQARENLLRSRTVLSLLKDVETGQRGYILTGDEHYLAPYAEGVRETLPAFEHLVRALRLDDLPPDAMGELRALIGQRVELARSYVETRKLQGFAAAQAAVMGDEGRRLMDDIRRRFADLDRRLRSEIDRRNQAVMMQMRRAQWFTAGLTVSALAMIALAYVLLLRETRLRERAERALQAANADLEQTVAARTAQLQRAQRESEAFAARLDRDIEAERRRLAREVHDQLGQVFTALRMVLEGMFHTHACSAAERARVNALLDDGIGTTRRIAAQLRPPLFDDLGFGPALTHLAQQFGEQSGLPVTVQLSGAERVPPERGLQLYRIAQESLTNVARHAQAARVRIEGAVAGGDYRLIIEDDGCGMAQVQRQSQGLSNMRERAALAGGRLQFETGSDGGVRVSVCVPLGTGEHGQAGDSDR